jgi:glycosyltransferase involved in cell wall biosynthesis
MERIKLAYLNDSMLPYHYARLEAANKLLDCTFIEFSSIDHSAVWNKSIINSKKKITLFNDKSIIEQSNNDVRLKVFQCLSNLNPDIVLISGWDALCSLYAMLWCVKNSKPMIILSESQEFDFKRLFIKEIVKSNLLKLIDSAFVGGGNQKKYLMKLGFNSKAIFKGCDIIDNKYFLENANFIKSKENYYRAKLGLPKYYFFVSCRLIKKKNLMFLIDTYSKFVVKNKNWHLVIAGDGILLKELKELTIKLKIGNMITFLGYVQYNEIPYYYSLSSCFILPSVREQWGLVVNEALACGIPVIVSNRCGSAFELVENNKVGYTFDPYDQSDLLDKMNKIINQDTRSQFSKNSFEIISKYNLSNFGENLKKASEHALLNFNNNHSIISKIILNLLIIFNRIR